jgi:hypothetical protein
VNPGSALRCDCGYSFADGTMGAPLVMKVSEAELRERTKLRAAAPIVSICGLVMLARMIQVVIRDGYHRSDAAVMILMSALAVLLVAAGIALRVRR